MRGTGKIGRDRRWSRAPANREPESAGTEFTRDDDHASLAGQPVSANGPQTALQRPARQRSLWSRLGGKGAAVKLLSLVLFVAFWQLFIVLFDIRSYLLPAPSGVAAEIQSNFSILMEHGWTTLLEAFSGLTLAGIVGVLLAAVMVYSPALRGVIMPGILAFNAVPKAAFGPLLIVWLGLGIESKIALAFLLAFFPIVVNTTTGMSDIEPELINLARLTRARSTSLFVKIRLPHALPTMFDGFTIALPLSIIGAIVGEFLAASRGLGYLMNVAGTQLNTELVFAALVVIIVFSLVIYSMLAFVKRKLLRWRPSAR